MSRHSNESLPRRAVLGAGAAVIGWAVPQVSAAELPSTSTAAGPDDIVVTLLGTGSPTPVADRYGMSTLVQAGGLNLLFDAGRSCAVRLAQARVQGGVVRRSLRGRGRKRRARTRTQLRFSRGMPVH